MLLYSYRMQIEQNFRNEKVSVLVSACVPGTVVRLEKYGG